MDFSSDSCGHILHNFSENCTKKYCRPLPAKPTHASLLNAVYEWNLTAVKWAAVADAKYKAVITIPLVT
jgi:hypothetical protein